MNNKQILYADLVEMSSPQHVFTEVCQIMELLGQSEDLARLETVFGHVRDLYQGAYPGYGCCTTHYHDLRHTTDVFLALARLIHGARGEGVRFAPQETFLALVSALMHDCGYIQTADDRVGTGGKFTKTHVARSIRFMGKYFAQWGYRQEETEFCASLIQGTSLTVSFEQIDFPGPSAALLGKFVASADFLGQIADRLYLEKLLFLYREFREANVLGVDSELELLKNTVGFYGFMQKRLNETLGGVQKYMRSHFRTRYDLDRDLYQEAVERNIAYLNRLLHQNQHNYRHNLKRQGIVATLEALESREAKSSGR
jgi:hypothetical protein